MPAVSETKLLSQSKWRRLPKYSPAYIREAKLRAGPGFYARGENRGVREGRILLEMIASRR